jgi:small subunit ribosomal protein S21
VPRGGVASGETRRRKRIARELGLDPVSAELLTRRSMHLGTATMKGYSNYETEVSLLAEVLLNAGESLESALKRFKRKVMTEDIIKDIKRHAFYLKPGQKMRVKAALARKRSRKTRSRDSDSDASRR